MSLLSSGIILASFLGFGYYFVGDLEIALSEDNQLLTYAMIFVYYLVFSFVTFFFNTAILTAVNRRLHGQDNKFGDGIRDSFKHIGKIFQWSMISATVATLLKIIEHKFGEDSWIGRMVVGLLGAVWSISTFFAFPIMIINGKGPNDAIKESAKLFKKTWGERAVIHVGVGFFFFLLFLLIIFASIFIGIYINSWVGISVFVVGFVFYILLSSSSDVVIKTILFHYATTGELPNEIENKELLKNIVKQK